MKKRSMKVLLQIMLDNIDKLDTGLCELTIDLFDRPEREYVYNYIQDHAPRNNTDAYYWPEGEKAPRIKWLKYHIKKLSK